MTKIFIVDDERLIVDGLICLINSFDLELEIVGVAYDGLEALEKIKSTKPDIVISDIKMNQMDGLELVERLKTLLPFSKNILLTGYSEFSYAQSAVRSGVFDYLLKPVSEDTLYQCIAKAKKEIARQTIERSDLITLKDHLKQIRPFIRDLFLSYLKRSDGLEQEPPLVLSLFDFKQEKSYYIPFFIRFNTDESILSNSNYEQMYLLFNQIMQIIEMNKIEYMPFFDNEGMVFIFKFSISLNPDDVSIATHNTLNDIRDMLDFNLSLKFSIGLGSVTSDIREIPNEYEHAKTASEYRFYLGDNRIIAYEDLDALSDIVDNRKVVDIKEKLILSLRLGNINATNSELDRYIEVLKKSGEPILSVKSNCMETFLNLLNSMNELAFANKFPEGKTSEIISLLWQSSTIDEMAVILRDFISLANQQLSKKRIDKNLQLIRKIKNIIEESYNNVSLESISNEIQLSPSYISNLFSNVEKTTIKEYIITTKIHHSKELLKNPSYKIYEISDLVGYSDSKYFSQLFKRYTGLTPEQYRMYQS